MARTKYKLGTFVKLRESDDEAAHYGAVEEIRQTTGGTLYVVTGVNDPVNEDAIETSYREVQPRKPAATKRPGKKKAKASEAQAA